MNQNIFLFIPNIDSNELPFNRDDNTWSYRLATSQNSIFLNTRHICFGNLGSFIIDLDKVNVDLFESYEIPKELVSKLQREHKINNLLK